MSEHWKLAATITISKSWKIYKQNFMSRNLTLYILCLKDSRNKVFWWAVIRFSFQIFFFFRSRFDLLTFANFLRETDSIIRISKNQLCPPFPYCSISINRKWALVVYPMCTSFREGRKSLTDHTVQAFSRGTLLSRNFTQWGIKKKQIQGWGRSYCSTCFGILLKFTHLLK